MVWHMCNKLQLGLICAHSIVLWEKVRVRGGGGRGGGGYVTMRTAPVTTVWAPLCRWRSSRVRYSSFLPWEVSPCSAGISSLTVVSDRQAYSERDLPGGDCRKGWHLSGTLSIWEYLSFKCSGMQQHSKITIFIRSLNNSLVLVRRK